VTIRQPDSEADNLTSRPADLPDREPDSPTYNMIACPTARPTARR
jgi:hypothetical protein